MDQSESVDQRLNGAAHSLFEDSSLLAPPRASPGRASRSMEGTSEFMLLCRHSALLANHPAINQFRSDFGKKSNPPWLWVVGRRRPRGLLPFAVHECEPVG